MESANEIAQVGLCGIKDDNRFGQDHVKALKILGTKVHLWTLEIPSNDIQILEHVISSEIPLDHTEVGKIFDLGNFVWKLEVDPEVSERTNLSNFAEREIQKPAKGSKYGVLLPEQLEDYHIQKNVV
ncbi:hypothetical protein K501DRAFT_270678 [Backusella circina FSU 941]|nr:hypothetical protein K501DRAFT_270678 [Backusella circina FSU 941]